MLRRNPAAAELFAGCEPPKRQYNRRGATVTMREPADASVYAGASVRCEIHHWTKPENRSRFFASAWIDGDRIAVRAFKSADARDRRSRAWLLKQDEACAGA